MPDTAPIYQCPDCAGTESVGEAGAPHFEHDFTCPAAIAMDQLMERDAQFFQDHPGCDRYWRPFTQAEIVEKQALGLLPTGEHLVPVGKVLVLCFGPGVRCRRFFDAQAVTPDGFRFGFPYG